MESPRAEVDPQDMQMIDEYLEHLRRGGCTEATLSGRHEILYRLSGELPYGVGVTDQAELKAWLYRDSWSQNTKYTYYMCLKSFYAWAMRPEDPWLDRDPFAGLEVVTAPEGVARPVTDEQLRRVLTEARDPYRLWATIAAYQGLRCVEISRLDREHITSETLFVVKGKGGRPRVHDVDPYVWAAVKDLPLGPIARRPNGERADPTFVSVRSALYFRHQLKMPGVSLHKMRHWLGVTMQKHYKDIRVTQRALGHRSLSSTQIYTAASDDQLREARASLPRLAG